VLFYKNIFDIFVNITTFRLNFFLSLLVIMKKFFFSFLLLFSFSIAFANASYTSDEKAAYTWAFNK
jgi:hypothetical protein